MPCGAPEAPFRAQADKLSGQFKGLLEADRMTGKGREADMQARRLERPLSPTSASESRLSVTSNEADIPLDFPCWPSIGAVTESRP